MLAQSVMQHIATAINRDLHSQFDVYMVAYSMIGLSSSHNFQSRPSSNRFSINPTETVLKLTSAMLCMGLSIIVSGTMTPADVCILNLLGCAAIMQQASHLDILQILG
jgi:hypothetical protein